MREKTPITSEHPFGLAIILVAIQFTMWMGDLDRGSSQHAIRWLREKQGYRYLVDETTAVTRFIFPCGAPEEADQVRYLFEALFVESIIQLINAEDEIWMVESGDQNRVHIWSVEGDDDDGELDSEGVDGGIADIEEDE